MLYAVEANEAKTAKWRRVEGLLVFWANSPSHWLAFTAPARTRRMNAPAKPVVCMKKEEVHASRAA